jgi:transmembrane sensor
MNTEKKFNKIDELILAFLRESINAEELEYLKIWLAESKDHKNYFREMYLLWKASAVSLQNEDSTDKAFQKVCLKIFETDSENMALSKSKKKGYFYISWAKWAAVIFLSVCTGAFLNYLYNQSHSDTTDRITQNEINVPLGSKSKIILPDRTEVWLNAGSKLTYTMSYGKKLREVNLEGEGYFKVAKMSDKPFIVHTLNANIKALGTEFNVKAYPDENAVETILVKGSVVVDKISTQKNLQKTGNYKSLILKPGQKVLIFKSMAAENKEKTLSQDQGKTQPSEKCPIVRGTAETEMSPRFADTEVETSWKDPNWVIQGENIDDVFIKLRRRFNISIILLDKELNKYKFSGIIENETLEQVFDLMSLTIPISYSIEKGKVDISLNRKLEKKYRRAYEN